MSAAAVLGRSRLLLVAAGFLALAAVLLLFALDVRGWQRTLTRDDLRFRALHGHVGLWGSPAALPGDPARRLLGLGDALDYRQALQLFWYGRVGSDPQTQADLNSVRVDAQDQLEAVLEGGATGEERSTAANLLGVMTVTTPTSDSETQMQTLHRAAGYFRRAIGENPTNYAAKANLELVLRIEHLGKSRFGKDARGGFGFGRGRGASVGGSGF
ncbi:MAG TPA: hypothetical protein VFJ91_08215 [Gaiellaceae bacterium]|nr:hypothetical protein [Gaiellaceae bacterium]